MADSIEFNFIISGQLTGANEMTRANRSHWTKGAKLRKKDLEWCISAIYSAKMVQKPAFSSAVAVKFFWYEPNAKRDPDNIISGQKAILDALVRCKIIPNDTQRYVKRLVHFIDIDERNPRIEVNVYGIPTSHPTQASG